MLKYNFQRVFKLRGIVKPLGFLVKHGFSNSTAFIIAHNKIKSLTPQKLEKLCMILKCTPNDLFEWIPDKSSEDNKTNPLSILKREAAVELSSITEDFSLEKMEQIAKNLKQLN